MTLQNRLEKLETASVGNAKPIYIWKNADETREQAIARWSAQNDGQDPEKLTAQVYLLCWGDETAA